MDSLLASALLLFLNTSYTVAQEGTCITNLPPFVNQETQQSPQLPVGIQALVPSYRFTCDNTSILRWGVAIHGGRGGHGIHLQVWRPAMQEGQNQLFKLVDSNYFFIEPSVREKLIHLIPGERWRIQVMSGDIVGFYLEDNLQTTDDFRLQHQQSETASMVLYSYAQAPYSTIDTADDMSIRLINVSPTIRVQLDSEPAQTSNRSPAVTSQTTPTDTTPTTATTPTTDMPTTTTTMPTTTMPTTTMPTTTTAPASTQGSETTLPPTTHPSTPPTTHRTAPSTNNPTTDSTTPSTTPPNTQGLAILIGCLVVGGVCVMVLVVVWTCLRKRRSQQKGPMPSPTSERGSMWNLSDTLLTENHAYDHTHTGLIASWDWLPKYAKTKFRIWKALDYEHPIRTCPTPSKPGHKLERSYNQYECPAPFLQSIHHYEEITVPATPTTITPTKTTPTNSP